MTLDPAESKDSARKAPSWPDPPRMRADGLGTRYYCKWALIRLVFGLRVLKYFSPSYGRSLD